jgi:hypothetical protein
LVFSFLAILVAAGCVAASLRRIQFASESTGIDPRLILAALRGDREDARAKWRAIEAEIAGDPAMPWEQELVEALGAGPHEARVALVNEALGELDYRAQRWVRVPRVCASIATSFGFLLASLAMRTALAGDDVDVDGAVMGAVNVAVVGVAGAIFCVASQARAAAIVKERMAAVDKLVARLEALA